MVVKCPRCGENYEIEHLNPGDRLQCCKCQEVWYFPTDADRIINELVKIQKELRRMHTEQHTFFCIFLLLVILPLILLVIHSCILR